MSRGQEKLDHQSGCEDERDAIVEWLRLVACRTPEEYGRLNIFHLADQIERGVHNMSNAKASLEADKREQTE